MASFNSLYAHGFVRVAAAAPRVWPADPARTAAEPIALARRAHDNKAALALFPELGLSGYAIDDLLLQDAILDSVLAGLKQIVEASRDLLPVMLVGAPLKIDGGVFNCGIAIH